MEESFQFIDMDGQAHQVVFTVIHTEGEFRVYGVRACMISDGAIERVEEVTERFITLNEAKETLKMLCHYQVMPCTLRDVI